MYQPIYRQACTLSIFPGFNTNRFNVLMLHHITYIHTHYTSNQQVYSIVQYVAISTVATKPNI